MDAEMVSQNIGLVHQFARKWEWRTKNTAADFDDLFSEGCIGLIKAANTFDPEKGFKFSSHACSQIEYQILNFLNRQLPVIHYPHQIRAMIKAIKNDELTLKQVVTRFKCPQHVARLAYDCAHTTVVSLNSENALLGEDSITLEDTISSVDDFSAAHADEFMSTLSAEDQAIVHLIDRGLTKSETAAEMSIDYYRVTKKMESIRVRLRQYQMGLPYRGYRSTGTSDRQKIPQ